MKKALTLLLLGITFNAFSQGTQTHGRAWERLDVSNINSKIFSFGYAFEDMANEGFEVPRGSGKNTIFAGALWISGKDQQNQQYVAAQSYGIRAGFWPGPIANVQDSLHTSHFDKLWKVSKTEIQNHIANYNKAGYAMPNAIATWPGNGVVSKGEAAQLAPFIDINNDGIYSPTQGDYPKIIGDQAIYSISNDRGNIKRPYSLPMNTEIHIMHYGFNNSNNSAVFHTLFTEYRIINRGQINFNDFYASVWTDMDIGFGSDDFVGCDTIQHRYFGYNADNYDGDSTGTIYGSNPPTQSVIFLDKPMSRFIYYNNDGNPITGNPDSITDIYNLMRGKWRSGSNLTYGGNGTASSNVQTNFAYPGNPVTGTGWSEINNLTSTGSNTPYDRRAVGSIGPFILNAGQELKFTVAYNYSRGTSNLNSLVTAAQDAQTVQNFFNNTVLLGRSEEITKKQTLKLYPNPANDLLHIQLPNSFENKEAIIAITDYTGRIVLKTTATKASTNQQLNISDLSNGIYQVTVTSEKQTITSKLVKL